jgi:Tol biopolymer transport system component
MDDLRRRFASLDRVPAPDLWDAIERRAVAAGPTTRVRGVVRPAGMRAGTSGRRQLALLVALAALLAALVVGTLVAGSLRPDRLAIVVNPPATVALPENAAPSAAPSASSAPTASPAGRPWLTGQELMDALSAEYGYTWSPNDVFDVGWWGVPDGSRSGAVLVEAPLDGPATVSVDANTDAVAEVGLHASRVAQLLSPEALPWVEEVIAQGLGADWASFTTKPYHESSYRSKVLATASGGQVRVHFVDPPRSGDQRLAAELRAKGIEPPFDDYLGVTFLLEPAPPTPALDARDGGLVLYSRGGEIWTVNRDGTNARLLLTTTAADGASGNAASFGWAPDGSRVFYNDGGDVFDIGTDGSPPVRIGYGRDDPRCPVAGEPCEGNQDLAVSPDGLRLAYLIGLDAIGLYDLATGQVTRIAFDSERQRGCDGPPAGGGPLQWSPNGTRFVFGASIGPKVDGWCQGAIFTVNVDGTDLRRVTPRSLHALDPRWSPDGSTIVFSSVTPRSAWEGGDATRIPIDMDIHSVRPDGSGLTALTSDGRSDDPHWTRDGRIVFIRWDAGPTGVAAASGRGDVRIMDADGQNASALDTTVPAETAAGCLVCPYPDEQGLLSSDGHRFWRPGQP